MKKSSLESIYSFLEKWGIKKPWQTRKWITLRKGELIEMIQKYEKYKKDSD